MNVKALAEYGRGSELGVFAIFLLVTIWKIEKKERESRLKYRKFVWVWGFVLDFERNCGSVRRFGAASNGKETVSWNMTPYRYGIYKYDVSIHSLSFYPLICDD